VRNCHPSATSPNDGSCSSIGLSIAMGNASDQVKKQATSPRDSYTTKGLQSDGALLLARSVEAKGEPDETGASKILPDPAALSATMWRNGRRRQRSQRREPFAYRFPAARPLRLYGTPSTIIRGLFPGGAFLVLGEPPKADMRKGSVAGACRRRPIRTWCASAADPEVFRCPGSSGLIPWPHQRTQTKRSILWQTLRR